MGGLIEASQGWCKDIAWTRKIPADNYCNLLTTVSHLHSLASVSVTGRQIPATKLEAGMSSVVTGS